MRVTVGWALAAGAAVLALASPAVAGSVTAAAASTPAGANASAAINDPAGTTNAAAAINAAAATNPAAATDPAAATPDPTAATKRQAATNPAAGHVVLVGIGGLRWSDVSPTVTPALWRLASEGAVGSLVVSGIHPRTCPADGWLTLNAAARAAVPHAATGPCPAPPAVTVQPSRGHPGAPSPARYPADAGPGQLQRPVPLQPAVGPARRRAGAAGPGRCATAVGPGAALALASPDGRVASYLPSVAALTSATLARCPLTVVDLGNLPAAPGPAGTSARAAAAGAADRQLGRIMAGLPAGRDAGGRGAG